MGRSGRAKDLPCTRDVAVQWGDRSGVVRRADHRKLERLDLLSDDELDRLRADPPGVSEEALDAHEAMEATLEGQMRGISDEVLAARAPARKPILVTVVCPRCGAFDLVRTERAWSVVRTMKRTGWSERDVLEVSRLLDDAFSDGDGEPEGVLASDLDELTIEQLEELRAAIGQSLDSSTLRRRYGPR